MACNELTVHNLKKEFIQYILMVLVLSYISHFVSTVAIIGSKSLYFKSEYSYNNIKLYTANPIDEIEAKTTLENVYTKISKSTLYKSNSDYIVYYTNSDKTEDMFFRFHDILINIKTAYKNKSNLGRENISSIILDKSLEGYVYAWDTMGTAFVRQLEEDLISHELAHQMINRAFADPIIGLYSLRINTPINEGYANLIAYDLPLDYKYISSDLIGNSWSIRQEDVLHEDEEYYKHKYFTINWDDDYYVDNYSVENILIVRNLLLEKDIISLLKGLGSRKKLEKETENFYLNYLQSKGYHKIKGDEDTLEGSWVEFRCDYEDNPCKFQE